MKFVRPVLVVLGSLVLLAGAPARSGEVRFGHLAIQWPDGYALVRAADPVLLRGPQAQEVAVSVTLAAAGPETRAAAPAEQRSFAARSATLLRSAAASHGRVVRVARSVLPDGSLLVATASQARGAPAAWLLQFAVLAPAGHVGYLTVQGQGARAAAEYQRLLPHFQSVRWVPDVQVAAE